MPTRKFTAAAPLLSWISLSAKPAIGCMQRTFIKLPLETKRHAKRQCDGTVTEARFPQLMHIRSSVRFTDIISLSWWPFSYRAGTRGSGSRREFQHAPVMLCKCLVHTPFAMPDSFLPLVVCVLHLLRERR